MPNYTITGTATFSSQANRDSARTRVDTALLAYTYQNTATTFTAGVSNPTTTTMTISLMVTTDDDDLIRNIRRAIYDAWVLSNRHTSGWLSSNKVS